MVLNVSSEDGSVQTYNLPDSDFEFAIGRANGSEILLTAGRVSRRHAKLVRSGGVLVLLDVGSSYGTYLNDERLEANVPMVLSPGDRVKIEGYVLGLGECIGVEPSGAQTPSDVKDEQPSVPRQAVQAMRVASDAGKSRHEEEPCSVSVSLSEFGEEFKDADVLYTEDCMLLKRKLHTRILTEMNLSEDALKEFADESMMSKLETCVDATLKAFRHELPSNITLSAFRQALMDELVGYGPLSPILRSPKISEIMVNGPDRIFVESKGKLMETGVRFFNERHLIQIIQRIVEPLGRHVDDASPMVDARLPDGSRVNAIIPPLALDGASLTIRKFADKKLTTDDLIGFGSMTKEMALFLEEAVRARRNILVSGGTGSGKTTLLNVLSQFIPQGERVVTVEDSAELKLSHRNIVRLEARPANIEGKGRVAIRDLVINCLRMRPDRIIVGECRGAEALDMLQAMNTGHDGSLTTAHANNPRDALSRLENMVMMAGFELPSSAIREQIASAIHLIVQQTRLPDGSRKIVTISEVTGRESNVILLQDIFKFEQEGFDKKGHVIGHHTATGNIPYFIDELSKSGNLRLDRSVFVPTS
ncbi:MAG: Flp pilus assembly complex ATPase component TadA [Kiritimatiellae bacterium]|nr:Flp pilus assembly complex ATPase component TadA [Kiritimatiellia bacterium]MBQ6139676.1 Flp pilus assembly complex ATPase component TadA [Kiritimatiellia bacterium]